MASKYMVTWHARNTLTKNGGSTLRFGSLGPQKVSDPPSLGSNLQSCTELIVCSFESPWRDKQTLNEPKWSIYNTFWNIHGERNDNNGHFVFLLYFSKYLYKSVVNSPGLFFSRQELSNEHTMSFVPQFWIFDLTIGVADLFGGRGTKTQRRVAVFDQRVSGMTGHLIFACQVARPKKFFFGHPRGKMTGPVQN